jgi:hypothetical protein
MSATYNGLTFDTPLLAQWAAFFDLAEWHWTVEVAAIGNWKPDFQATFECGHSECSGSHTIFISVLPINDLNGVKGHPALNHRYSIKSSSGKYLADAGAVFGSNPDVSEWEMSHGAGGGIDSVSSWVHDAGKLWSKAKLIITDTAKV